MSAFLQLLLLEDDPADAELILRYLQKAGFELDALIVSDGPQFQTAIRSRPFDAILADNALPQFSSVEALRLLRKEGFDTAFILVTGTVSEEFAVEVMRIGADDYILKNNLTRLPAAIIQAIERKKARKEKFDAQAALIQSERRYRTLFQRNLAGIYQSDPDGRIIDCNNSFCSMLGYSHAGEICGVDPGCFFLTDRDRKHFMSRLHYERFLSNYELVLRRRDGSALYTLGNITVLENPETGTAQVEGMLIDISDRRKAEQEIQEINHELHILSSHLQDIREEERKQIARDIHDELGQLLTAMKMDVYSLKSKVDPNDREVSQKIGDILELIGTSVNSVRHIAAQLRPAIIDDLGLTAALDWHNREVEKRHGLRIDFVHDQAEGNIPPATVTGLFRIYQEALTNVIRHANAKEVHSSLKMADGRIVLEISDDGKGFNAAFNGKGKSFGLLGIKERVFLMGGKFDLRSEPGLGTSIAISIPADEHIPG